MRRLVLAGVCGVVAAAIAYAITSSMAEPDTLATTGHYSRGAYKFVGYVTALGGGAVFLSVLLVQNTLAKKKWRAELAAPARVVR